jgi:hypothetical protein
VFPDHPAAVRSRGRTVCVVANDLVGLTEDATRLGQLGLTLHVLLCRPFLPSAASEMRRHGIPLHRIDDCLVGADAPNVHGPCPSDASDQVRRVLERLHGRYAFDTVVFPVRGGLGFRAIQARDARLSFQGVTFAVYLDACSAWLRDRAGRWPSGLDELELDYIERRAFERADVQFVHNPDLLEYVRTNGWAVMDDVVIGSWAQAALLVPFDGCTIDARAGASKLLAPR